MGFGLLSHLFATNQQFDFFLQLWSGHSLTHVVLTRSWVQFGRTCWTEPEPLLSHDISQPPPFPIYLPTHPSTPHVSPLLRRMVEQLRFQLLHEQQLREQAAQLLQSVVTILSFTRSILLNIVQPQYSTDSDPYSHINRRSEPARHRGILSAK